jgi:hypothetical protein
VATLLLPLSLLAVVAVVAVAHARTPSAKPPTRVCAEPAAVPAPASNTLSLSASLAQAGCIQLTVSGAAAAPVSITEIIPDGSPLPAATLLPQGGQASTSSGLPWSCSSSERTFQAVETLPDGSQGTATTTVRTPGCADRLTVSVPPTRLHRGYPLIVAVRDRWRLGGVLVHVCETGMSARACPELRLKPGSIANVIRLRALRAGAPSLTVYDEYQRIRRRLHVYGSRPLLLATGDSEMQVLDELMASDLGGSHGAQVVGDAKQSTAISSPFFFNWPGHAVGQVYGLHPDIVAMFLGGNEGFRLGSAECCGSGWSREYANRVAGMMHRYLQGGAAAVYWFLIPTPSREPFVKVVRAVNYGIEMAARRFKRGVHVFDLRPVFSPGGRYRSYLNYGRSSITVHESDGFHLSSAADVIVAHMFIGRLRADGLLP